MQWRWGSKGQKMRGRVREWRCCCGVWVFEVEDRVFCCGNGVKRRERDNAGRLGDHSEHIICN